MDIRVERSPDPARLSALGVEAWEVWSCEPSTFPWRYDEDETCFILAGRARVTPDGGGAPVEFSAGDLVVFPAGLSCTWEVLEPVRKRYRFGPAMRVRIPPEIVLPMPVVLVGTTIDGRANLMPAGWCCRANVDPPMIALALHQGHRTTEAIRATRSFSVCLPSTAIAAQVDACGMASGRNADKSSILPIEVGETGVPLVRGCPLQLECRLERIIDLPSNALVIGHIVAAWAEADAVDAERHPVWERIDPLLLTLPDAVYRRLGTEIGKAWSIGAAFTPSSP